MYHNHIDYSRFAKRNLRRELIWETKYIFKMFIKDELYDGDRVAWKNSFDRVGLVRHCLRNLYANIVDGQYKADHADTRYEAVCKNTACIAWPCHPISL